MNKLILKIQKRRAIEDSDYKRLLNVKNQIDRKFVIEYFGLLNQYYCRPRVSDIFAVFNNKGLLEANDIYLLDNDKNFCIEYFSRFHLDFKTEHLIYLKEFDEQIIINLANNGAKLNQELIDYYCQQEISLDFLEFLENQDIVLSSKNINDLCLSRDLSILKKLKNKISIDQKNIEEFFLKLDLKYFEKKIKDTKINIKCLENACLLPANMGTIRSLIEKYGISPNDTCLENVCSVYNNSKVIEYLTDFDLGVTRQCLINVIKNDRCLIANHITKLLIRKRKPELADIEGVEAIE